VTINLLLYSVSLLPQITEQTIALCRVLTQIYGELLNSDVSSSISGTLRTKTGNSLDTNWVARNLTLEVEVSS
jgi:hypothetical protein